MRLLVSSFVTAIGVAGAAMTSPLCPLADDAPAPHASHDQKSERLTRSTADYTVPPVELVRDDGKIVSLAEELEDGRPVVLNFVFTSCTAICPAMSRAFSQMQQNLGSERDKVRMASISIDPEQDTPARLAEYAKKFGAGPQWHYYTGSREASIAAQRAFNVYRGDKMNHNPVTFLRATPGTVWVRLDGFVTADELEGELRDLIASASDRSRS